MLACSKAQSSVEDIKDTKNAPLFRDCLHGLGSISTGGTLYTSIHTEASWSEGHRVKSQPRRLAQEFDTPWGIVQVTFKAILYFSWCKSPCPVCFFEEISWWRVCVFRVSYTYNNSWHLDYLVLSKQIFSSSSFPEKQLQNPPISFTCLNLQSLQVPIVHSHGTQKLDQTCVDESPATVHWHHQLHPTYGSHPEWPKSRLTTR